MHIEQCTYDANKVLVAHLLDRNIVHKPRDYGPRAFWLAKVDLLDASSVFTGKLDGRIAHLNVQTICIWMPLDWTSL